MCKYMSLCSILDDWGIKFAEQTSCGCLLRQQVIVVLQEVHRILLFIQGFLMVFRTLGTNYCCQLVNLRLNSHWLGKRILCLYLLSHRNSCGLYLLRLHQWLSDYRLHPKSERILRWKRLRWLNGLNRLWLGVNFAIFRRGCCRGLFVWLLVELDIHVIQDLVAVWKQTGQGGSLCSF